LLAHHLRTETRQKLSNKKLVGNPGSISLLLGGMWPC